MNDQSNNRAIIEHVKASGIAVSKAAKEVYEGLRTGKISIADATELSNALGKANGGDSNAIKAVMTSMVLDKMEITYAKAANELQG